MVRGDQVDQGGDQVAKTGFSVGEAPRVIRLIRFPPHCAFFKEGPCILVSWNTELHSPLWAKLILRKNLINLITLGDFPSVRGVIRFEKQPDHLPDHPPQT